MTVQQAFDVAVQHHQAGRLGEAEAIYRQILMVDPEHAHALHLLGVSALQAGRQGAAVELIRRAIALLPDTPTFHSNLGRALTDIGQLDDAIAAYRRALELEPSFAQAHCDLAVVLSQKGQREEAIAGYRRALEIKPDFPEPLNNLGVMLSETGQFDEAIAACREALQIRPRYAEAENNLGNALRGQCHFHEAIAAYRRAIELKPDYPEAYNNLGSTLSECGHLDEAIASFRRAIQLKPDYAAPHNNLGSAFKDQAQLDEAVAHYRRAVALRPEDAALHSNLVYSAHFHPGYDPPKLREESAAWERQHAAPLEKSIRAHRNKPDPRRRLRVGYVSPNFSRHVISRFLTPLLEFHDHDAFEIFCYASVRMPDCVTERLRKTADSWRDVRGVRDEALAEQIRADGIDLLVDLTQHMADNRLLVFARKPAPVQVAWLGYPGTTGLRSIDYRFTDAYMEPEDSAWSESVEKPVRLPDSWFCFDPIDGFPVTGGLPVLREGAVTFGNLNNFCKSNESVLRLWAGVLLAVPGSRILLQCPEGAHRDRVRRVFESHGIGSQRVQLVSRTTTREDFLELFQRIDIALDPFPYNGGTTTCEALWMGIPVLTLPGSLIVSRIGLSILSAVGLPELVAHSEAGFVSMAASLAGDLPRLARMRATLRDRMRASPFMDGPRFARNVEHAYREMWRAWCATQSAPVP